MTPRRECASHAFSYSGGFKFCDLVAAAFTTFQELLFFCLGRVTFAPGSQIFLLSDCKIESRQNEIGFLSETELRVPGTTCGISQMVSRVEGGTAQPVKVIDGGLCERGCDSSLPIARVNKQEIKHGGFVLVLENQCRACDG